MIKSNSKNDTLNSPVSQDKKKTKQLTLFDLKSKSITINKENEKPTPVKLQNDKIITICDDERDNKIESKLSTSRSQNSLKKEKKDDM